MGAVGDVESSFQHLSLALQSAEGEVQSWSHRSSNHPKIDQECCLVTQQADHLVGEEVNSLQFSWWVSQSAEEEALECVIQPLVAGIHRVFCCYYDYDYCSF